MVNQKGFNSKYTHIVSKIIHLGGGNLYHSIFYIIIRISIRLKEQFLYGKPFYCLSKRN